MRIHCTTVRQPGGLRTSVGRTFAWSVLLVVAFSGCQHSRMLGLKNDADEPALPSYSALVLNYETSDFCSMLQRISPSAVSSSLSAHFQTVSAVSPAEEEEAHPENGQWSQARIQIIYPHPSGDESKGLARLIVTRTEPGTNEKRSARETIKSSLSRMVLRATGTTEELADLVEKPNGPKAVDQEIWQLDLAKEELDILLSELSHRGFFEQQERPRGEATVSIKVDEGAVSKRWTSEPRLEGLMLQVYNEGELAAFNTRTSRFSPLSQTRASEDLDG